MSPTRPGRALEQAQLAVTRALRARPTRLAQPLQQAGVDRVQERGPGRPVLAAVAAAARAVRQAAGAAGPGSARRRTAGAPRPPSLVGRDATGPAQRQQAVLAADQEHHRPLQALGGVQGEQGHRLGPRVQRVHLGPGREGLEERLEVVAAAGGQRQSRSTAEKTSASGSTGRRPRRRRRTGAAGPRPARARAARDPVDQRRVGQPARRTGARGRSPRPPAGRPAGRASASAPASPPASTPPRSAPDCASVR